MNFLQSKQAWRAHMARIHALPEDYQIVYKEMQRYLWKACPAQTPQVQNALEELVDLLEEGAAAGKDILDVVSRDPAGFCDQLIAFVQQRDKRES